MPGDKSLRNLAIAQFAIGVVASALAPIELDSPLGLGRILVVPLFASALGQAVLIAVWGVASPISPWMRMAGLVVGAAYLEALLIPGLKGEFLGIASVTIAVTTASLLVVRARGIVFTRGAEEHQTRRPDAEGLRFSIRGLMAFNAAVALLSAGARALQTYQGRFLLQAAVWALCFVAVGLVALWAALGEARPQRRGLVVFALSPVLGAFFAYAADAHQAGWAYIILTMLLFSVNLLGSLLVVRSCGYRLVRRMETSLDQASGGSLDGGPASLGRPIGGLASPEWTETGGQAPN